MKVFCLNSAAGNRIATASKTARGPVSSFAGGRIAPFKASPTQRKHERGDLLRVGFFKFGKNGFGAEDAGIVGAQNKDDFDSDDLEQYFNYMGFLAEEGNYDRMYALSNSGLSPIDAILILAAGENDFPKIQEILRAGANPNVKDPKGRTPLELASKPDVKKLIQEYLDKQKVNV